MNIYTIFSSIIKIKLPLWLMVVVLILCGYLYFSMSSSLNQVISNQSEVIKTNTTKISDLETDNKTLKSNNSDLEDAISTQNDRIKSMKSASDTEKLEYQKKLKSAEKLLSDRLKIIEQLNSEANTSFDNTDQASMLWLKSRASSSLAW